MTARHTSKEILTNDKIAFLMTSLVLLRLHKGFCYLTVAYDNYNNFSHFSSLYLKFLKSLIQRSIMQPFRF